MSRGPVNFSPLFVGFPSWGYADHYIDSSPRPRSCPQTYIPLVYSQFLLFCTLYIRLFEMSIGKINNINRGLFDGYLMVI